MVHDLADYAIAKDELENALKSTSDPKIQALIKLDLSKTLRELNKFDEALKIAGEAYTYFENDENDKYGKCKSYT